MTAFEYAKGNEQSNYLPELLKDFHDQKDFFRTLQEFYADDQTFSELKNGWVDNHVFVVDFFLYFMALHGYKLQRVRTKNVSFFELANTLKQAKEQRDIRMAKTLSEAFNQPQP